MKKEEINPIEEVKSWLKHYKKQMLTMSNKFEVIKSEIKKPLIFSSAEIILNSYWFRLLIQKTSFSQPDY